MSESPKLRAVVDECLFDVDEPFICKLHEIANDRQHVSIACSLARFVRFLKIDCDIYDAFLESDTPEDSELQGEYVAQAVLLRLYLIVERVELIFKAIYYPPEYKEREYPILARITRWANFLKHPRTSFFAHACDGVSADTVQVNEALVQDLWRGEKQANKTQQMLAGKHIQVCYPSSQDFETMIRDLSKVLSDLIDIINQNPKYTEIISDNSILEKRLEG